MSFLKKAIEAATLSADQKEGLPTSDGAYVIGRMIEGKGIYMGIWVPHDHSGRSLGKFFNVFAAPEDFPVTPRVPSFPPSFLETAKQVTALRGWHGYDGCDATYAPELYKVIEQGNYNGEWFIPTRDLLYGLDVKSNRVREDNLYDCKDKEDLKGTLNLDICNDDSVPYKERSGIGFYWSCTPDDGKTASAWSIRMADGKEEWQAAVSPTNTRCRLFRAEPLNM